MAQKYEVMESAPAGCGSSPQPVLISSTKTAFTKTTHHDHPPNVLPDDVVCDASTLPGTPPEPVQLEFDFMRGDGCI